MKIRNKNTGQIHEVIEGTLFPENIFELVTDDDIKVGKYLENTEKAYGDIDFEPDPESVMFYLMKAYLRNAYYYALLDSAAGEQGARRNAMKSATDNANEMVSTLTRIYNRARQGAITQEITEIVAGAEQ